jgi:RND family efflux transporter MFP subunit
MEEIMEIRHKRLAIILSIALTTSCIWGCGETEEEVTASTVAVVEAQNPTVGSLGLNGSFIATISPDESVYVIPKTTAEVLSVNVSEGDTVQEGDVLAVLDDTLAQIQMKSAEISRDNAEISYNLSYGEGAETLNDMQSDNTLSQAEDGVNDLQDSLVDAMDGLQKAKDNLKDAEDELDDLKEEYDFTDDVDEIKDYAESFDKTTLEGYTDYQNAMARYQEAVTEVTPVETKISKYKEAIDTYEESIEKIQDQIDSTYNSYSQAVTSNNISNGELREDQKQLSQNSISAAQLQIDQLQENLDAYTITAPISGVIETANISVHDYATSSSYAFVISNKDTMIATYYVSEDVRNTFTVGQKITLEKDDNTYEGEVVEIGSAIDQTTGLFKIKASVTGDTDGLLSGTKATVISDTYHEDNAIIIPYDSVYYDGSQAYVYTVVDGLAKRTNIETGLFDNDNIVVTSGLSATDTVITTWAAQLRDGVEVEIKNSQE